MQEAPDWAQPGLSSGPVGHGVSKRHPIGPEDSGADPGAVSTRIPNRVVAPRGIAAPTGLSATGTGQAHLQHSQSSQLCRAHRISMM